MGQAKCPVVSLVNVTNFRLQEMRLCPLAAVLRVIAGGTVNNLNAANLYGVTGRMLNQNLQKVVEILRER